MVNVTSNININRIENGFIIAVTSDGDDSNNYRYECKQTYAATAKEAGEVVARLLIDG